MKVKELIGELQKLPQEMDVTYMVEKGRGNGTVYAIRRAEVYENTWVTLKTR